MRNYASLFTELQSDLGESCDPAIPISSDMDIKQIASISLASSFYKKLCPSGNSTLADKNALEKFLSINESLGGPEWVFDASNEVESCFYDYFKDNLRTALDSSDSHKSYDLDFVREHIGVGPGAAQKADSTCMVSKLFESAISYVNPDLIRYYRAAISETGFWADAEMQRFQEYGFVKVIGGKLFFAAKNAEISRVCCTEPSLEMLIQKSVGEFIEYRLDAMFRINLSLQPDNNRELARVGSLDGSIGTIDLVSASDSIMLQLCKDALPHGFLKTMMLASRCRSVVLPDGREVELKMVSTMGNGFTFPLQTLIFSCAVRAAYQLMGFPCNCPKTQFGVFGDDICVRKEAYNFVSHMLTKLGFTVNNGKSFNTGAFRESCGNDYYNGHNVRGVYIKSLESPQYVYSAINRLLRWSSFQGIRLHRTLRLLMTWTRDLRVPPSEADDAGIHMPFKLTVPRVSDQYTFKYRKHVRRISRKMIMEPDSDAPPINENGVAVGFLAGVYRRRDILLTNPLDNAWKHDMSVSVSLRDRKGARPRYKIVSSSIHWWDYVGDSKYQSPDLTASTDERRISLTRDSWRRWEAASVDLFSSAE